MKIGVLALQGGYHKHQEILTKLGVTSVQVRLPKDLDGLDGLILPGGESTTIIKLILSYNMFDPIRKFAESKPIMGTCAGSILMGKSASRFEWNTFNLIDVAVERNAYGTQVDSFIDTLEFNGKSVEAMFIRAPKFSEIGNEIEILSTHNALPVVVRNQNHMMMTCHPELTGEIEFHKYFIEHFFKTL